MVRSLILNATYEPLSVVPCRRAVVLVARGRASVIAHRDEVWRSVSVELVVPSVVRLNSFVKVPYERIIPVSRRAVFGRDGHKCQYCGGPAESLDHVLPRSRGGLHTWDNVVACCRRCNLGKGDRTMGDAGLSLARRPTVPHRYSWIYASAGYVLDPTWQPFLLTA
jgi:5-methylcytosine-specific restriction endonuclease McrA